MLRELQVRNLALIESVEISLAQGLSVVTGETGAGKSIVVDSLMVLSGARATSDMIRTGAPSMTVSGIFDTPSSPQFAALLLDSGIEITDETVVRREVSREGRNRVYINDIAVTLRLLSQIAPLMIRVHTQREELELAESEMQRHWVDSFGGAKLAKIAEATRNAFQRFQDCDRKLQSLLADERSRLERIDLLRFQVREIESAAIAAGEERALQERREVLRHQDRIRNALANAAEGLYESDHAAGARIAAARGDLGGIADLVPAVNAWIEDLEDARVRVEEVGRAAAEQLTVIESDPGELDRVETRLADLERLFAKYGSGSDQVIETGRRAAAELEMILGGSESREQLEKQRGQLVGEYRVTASRLSAARQKAGAGLAGAVQTELVDLAMADAQLSVALEPRTDGLVDLADGQLAVTREGTDRVILMLSANPGEPPGPLAKIASGGELSRIYLALQLVAQPGGCSDPVVLVFDEVDAGVGGAQAEALGIKLRRLAESGQILAVTHLPQVASAGHAHLLVEKSSGQRTTIQVTNLSSEQRVEEIARMLAGRDVTEISRSHAADLLRQAAQ